MSANYVRIEGGEVVGNPDITVLYTDILNSDADDDAAISDVGSLLANALDVDAHDVIHECNEWLKARDNGDVTIRPTTTCGCGYELIWVGGRWEHDAAPYLWGDDHDADEPEPVSNARDYWDIEDGVRDE